MGSWDCKELDTTEQLTLSLYGGMKALINKEQRDCTPYFSISFLPPPPSTLARRGYKTKSHLQGRKRVLTRTQPCWHPDLRLPSPGEL